jgi:hypothetical protein
VCVCVCVVLAGTYGTVFWQCMNQSYNVVVNYSNRSASQPMVRTVCVKEREKNNTYVRVCVGER